MSVSALGPTPQPLPVKGEDATTSLLRAVDENNIQEAKRSIALGANIHGVGNDQLWRIPIVVALRYTEEYARVNDDVVRLLLDHGADINMGLRFTDTTYSAGLQRTQERTYTTLLHFFYARGYMCERLLKYGAKHDIPDQTGKTAAFLAAQEGSDLIRKGNVKVAELRDAAGNTPLHVFGRKGLGLGYKLFRRCQFNNQHIPKIVKFQ